MPCSVSRTLWPDFQSSTRWHTGLNWAVLPLGGELQLAFTEKKRICNKLLSWGSRNLSNQLMLQKYQQSFSGHWPKEHWKLVPGFLPTDPDSSCHWATWALSLLAGPCSNWVFNVMLVAWNWQVVPFLGAKLAHSSCPQYRWNELCRTAISHTMSHTCQSNCQYCPSD